MGHCISSHLVSLYLRQKTLGPRHRTQTGCAAALCLGPVRCPANWPAVPGSVCALISRRGRADRACPAAAAACSGPSRDLSTRAALHYLTRHRPASVRGYTWQRRGPRPAYKTSDKIPARVPAALLPPARHGRRRRSPARSVRSCSEDAAGSACPRLYLFEGCRPALKAGLCTVEPAGGRHIGYERRPPPSLLPVW